MSTIRALQGLFGGLNSGLGDYLQNQEKQAEMDNRAKLTAVQQLAEQRMAQKQAEEALQVRYNALSPEQDLTPEDAQPYIAAKMPIIKGPTGLLRRPKTVQEQSTLTKLTPEYIGMEAEQQFAPQAKLKVSEGVLDREARMAELRAQLQNALGIQQSHDATSLAVADRNNNGRVQAAEATSAAALARLQAGLEGKEIDEPKYMLWKSKYMQDPANQKYVQDAIAAGKSDSDIDLIMRRKIYPQYRNAGLN